MVRQIKDKYIFHPMPNSGWKIPHLYLENLHICFLILSGKFIFIIHKNVTFDLLFF